MKVFVLDNLSTSNRGILHLIILFFSTSLLSLWNLLSLSFEKWWWSGGNCLCHCPASGCLNARRRNQCKKESLPDGIAGVVVGLECRSSLVAFPARCLNVD